MFIVCVQLEYEKKMKIYENSPAYLAYLATKSKGKVKDGELSFHERVADSVIKSL